MHEIPTKRQAFSDHLQELRARLLVCVCALVIGSIGGYLLHPTVLTVLLQPLHQPVFYSSPAGGFDFILRISLLFGFVVVLPVLVYQTLQFVTPAFPYHSPKLFVTLFLASCVLLVAGMSFAYFVSLPAALYFLSGFATGQIQALITTDAYLSFVSRYLLGFGLLFQLPLVMFTMNSVQRISARQLMKFQRWVIVVSFLVAAILTPTPDLFNQALMAFPLILLYEFSVVLIAVVNRKRGATPH